MTDKEGLYIHIRGIVQGVGFRPFVYSLADRYGLHGWVRNTSRGVEIEVDGDPRSLSSFVTSLREDHPPLANIDSIHSEEIPLNGYSEFVILHSKADPGGFQPISPDVSICDDCLEELFQPSNHRYRYPFINCTNCGPRFTIIKDIPYDRPETTMAPFEMCEVCAGEYTDPNDRRFHAQPVACADCGPRVWLTGKDDPNALQIDQARHTDNSAVQETNRLLAQGHILAIKGLGGFHLACDAANHDAVRRLRSGKGRLSKPLAVMMPDLETVHRFCRVSPAEEDLLASPWRPIVLLETKESRGLSPALAPGQSSLGVMLPYTPLHYLLFSREDRWPDVPYPALVMTSGNHSNQPIATTNQDALQELGMIADEFLFHNRDIHIHCDDSVTRISRGQPYPIRRSRGYAPFPLPVNQDGPSILAAGAELKNTFCYLKGNQAFLSQHIGDLENYPTLEAFRGSLDHFEELFRIQPDVLAYDLHPDYLASRYALSRAREEGLTAVGVQHHHAHIASLLAEHGHPGQKPVIGCSFDGTGYGDDGHIWGGEVLLADYAGYHRAYHLRYTPLPGGDLAIKEPWRFALAWLDQAGIDWEPSLSPVIQAQEQSADADFDLLPILKSQLEKGINAPLTSSMGRLFDAVSALIGVRQVTDYEAQAAIELEAAAVDGEESTYPFEIRDDVIDPTPLFQAVVQNIKDGVPAAVISARFHNSVADMVLKVCRSLRKEHGLNLVALSGGVWQNMRLLEHTMQLLEFEGFDILTHSRVPANDGGLALGQAVIAQEYMLQKGD